MAAFDFGFVESQLYGIDEDEIDGVKSAVDAERIINVFETNYRREVSVSVSGGISIGLLTHQVVEKLGKFFKGHH